MDTPTLRHRPVIEARPPSPPQAPRPWDFQVDTQTFGTSESQRSDLVSSMAGLTVEPDLTLNENMKALFLTRVMEKGRKLFLRRVKETKGASLSELDDFHVDIEHLKRCYCSIFQNLPASFDSQNDDNVLAVFDKEKLHIAIQNALEDFSKNVDILSWAPKRMRGSEKALGRIYAAQIISPAISLEVLDREYQRRMYSDAEPLNFEEFRNFWLPVARCPQDVIAIRKVVRRAKWACKKWEDGPNLHISSVLERALWHAQRDQAPIL